MTDAGFNGGSGTTLSPFKKNEGQWFCFRGMFNRRIRKRRVINEWDIGFINNRMRIFLGTWTMSEHLWEMSYTNVSMISNWIWRREKGGLYHLKRRISEMLE